MAQYKSRVVMILVIVKEAHGPKLLQKIAIKSVREKLSENCRGIQKK